MDIVPFYRAHRRTPNTVSIYHYSRHTIKHQTQCRFTNHAITPIQCDVHMHMQCKMPLHVISCHMHNECYIDNTIHTTYQCHGQSHHLHMTSINHFIHVNLSCKHIPTFTFSMSFYDQAMTPPQARHIMAIAHNNSSHVNMLEYSLTSKQVTLNQVMKHSNK